LSYETSMLRTFNLSSKEAKLSGEVYLVIASTPRDYETNNLKNKDILGAQI